jgi:hypothetical protein
VYSAAAARVILPLTEVDGGAGWPQGRAGSGYGQKAAERIAGYADCQEDRHIAAMQHCLALFRQRVLHSDQAFPP